MSSKMTEREIKEKILAASQTMSPEADARVLSAARQFYAEKADHESAKTVVSGAEAAVSQQESRAEETETKQTETMCRKSELRRKVRSYVPAILAAAVALACVVIGATGALRKKPQTPDPTPVSTPVPTGGEGHPSKWEKGVYIAADVEKSDIRLIPTPVAAAEGLQTEGYLGVVGITYPRGITKQEAADYIELLRGGRDDPASFTCYESGWNRYLLTGMVNDSPDSPRYLIELYAGKRPGWVVYYTEKYDGLRLVSPTAIESLGIIRDPNRRSLQRNWPDLTTAASSVKWGGPDESFLPFDVTAGEMYKTVGAKLFIDLAATTDETGDWYPEYKEGAQVTQLVWFIVWKNRAIQVSPFENTLGAAWCDLTGDGEPELVTIGRAFGEQHSVYLYAYSEVNGRACEVAETLYTGYSGDWVFATGDDGALHIVSANRETMPVFDVRVELAEQNGKTEVTLRDARGILPTSASGNQ